MDAFWQYYVTGSGTGVIGFVSCIVSVIGFTATIWTTWQSRAAARRAEDAVLKVRRDLQRTNTTIELATAITLMVEIKKLYLQTQVDLGVLPDKYSAARNSLILINSTNTGMPAHYQSSIQSVITNLANLEKDVGKSIIRKQDYPDNSKTYDLISNSIDTLQKIQAEIRNTIGD